MPKPKNPGSPLRALAGAAGGLAIALAQVQAQAQTLPNIAPTGGIWDTGAGFHFDLGKKKALKTRQSLSGIACGVNAAQQRVCLAVFDEGVEARWATLHHNSLLPELEPVMLSAGTGELDAEGAATDGQYFYATGSHSAKRNSCDSNPDSRHVVRFRRDPATGRALRTPAGALVDYADTGRLWTIMQAQPALQDHVKERACLGAEGGVNIEGLAVRDGRLYFGLRSSGEVLAVDAEALFNGGEVHASVTPMSLGAGRGIRDMVAVQNGFLLLAGPDDDDAHKNLAWVVAWWDGKSSTSSVTPKVLATLDLRPVKLRSCDKEIKPEVITVLKETPQAYELLVLSDGMCDGGPLAFSVPHN
ncbi:DUF3616 domain-containing protein [Rhodoferax sp.]|uniref:DUF3616 domain-containing protein n=1 Tax=Rhodoferax sp. TaxID=50421 RepID=UPI00374DA4D8